MHPCITVILASPPHREKLVAILDLEEHEICEVNQEHENLVVEIYPRRDGSPWVLDLRDFMRALAEAESRLRERA